MNNAECSKCGFEMETGFLLELGDGNYRMQGSWMEGQPERSLFFGLKLKSKRILPIKALRCKRCGFLELYAADKINK